MDLRRRGPATSPAPRVGLVHQAGHPQGSTELPGAHCLDARTGHAWVHNVRLLRHGLGPIRSTTNHNAADKAEGGSR
jgi:hypothetical protein